ncbi:MAG: MFS transporter [Synergistaceae bacterium]|nr:MFS transporter [Synergistaceae bacterium]
MDNKRARNTYISCLINAAITLAAFHALPLFFVPMTKLIGGSMGDAQLTLSFCGTANLLTAGLVGLLVKKFPVKGIIGVSAVCITLFFFCFYFADSFAYIYAGGIFIGFAVMTAGFPISFTEVNWWFSKNTGKLMSFLPVAVGVMTFITSPIFAKAIETYGARHTALGAGVIMGGIVLISDFFLLSEHPGKYGIKIASEQEGSVDEGLPLNKILKEPSFWIVMAASFLVLIVLSGFMNNAPAFYELEMGVNPIKASLGVSIFSVASLVWSMLFGYLADKYNARIGILVCGVPVAVIFLAALKLNGFLGVALIATFFAGVYFVTLLSPVIYTLLYGKKESASIMGFSSVCAGMAAIIGAPVAGYIYDHFGSYSPFLIACSVFMAVAIVLVFIATNKNTYDRVMALRKAEIDAMKPGA